MSIHNSIEAKLAEAFTPEHIQVINESHLHNVPTGSESHFKVVLVAKAFEGKRLLARHRAVNNTLKEELDQHIHALALHTYTEQEWQRLYGEFPASPDCLGGMKREAR